MDGIEITITGSSPLEALARIGAFGMHCLANEDVCAAASRIYNEAAAKEKAAQLEAKQTPQASPTPTTGGAGAAAPATSAPAPAPIAPTYTPAPPTPAPIAPAYAPAQAPAPTAPVPIATPSPVPAPATTAPPVTPAPATAPIPSPNALPVQTVIASPSNAPVAPTAAPTFTLDDITRAGADFIVRYPGKQAELNALFPQFGITTLAELRPDQMGPFATAMRALGVSI